MFLIEEFMKISFENHELVLAQGEIKVFSVTIFNAENKAIYAKVVGVEGECLSGQGKDYLGKNFERTINLKAREEKTLWFYVKAPYEVGGRYASIVFYDENSAVLAKREILLKTTEIIVGDEQFNDIYSLRRLAWLNSSYAINDDVPAPFMPVEVKGKRIRLLGREIEIGEYGLPDAIGSYFAQGIKIGGEKKEILSSAIRFDVMGQAFKNESLHIATHKDKAMLSVKNESEDFVWNIRAETEFDGFISYKMTLTAKRAVKTENIRLVLPVKEDCRKYFMGLGKDGGYFDNELSWKWDEKKQQDGFWVGDVNAGLRVQFKGGNYRKPLVNIYYAHNPLLLPEGWANDGKGGIAFEEGEFIAYTGEKSFAEGESVAFYFILLITPLKEIDLRKQLQMRLYHKLDGQPEEWLKTAKEKGANIINVHHGNDLNPYINYPFFEREALTKFVQEAHANDIKVKIYYTIRELTINTPEFFALRDFGHEFFEKHGEVEGSFWQSEAKEWIRKNIGADVIPAWRQVLHGEKYTDEYDASVITNGCSRLCNFYVEGLRSLLSTSDLDGLYIDDVAYDRNTMKRVRKVLDEREGRYIDFHTWNHNFNDLAGNTSCAYLYTELFPYIDKLWIGEGFDYNSSPDFWLVEISGIPFGLMSEMLEADWQEANQWKGLVYGMTTRLGWTDEKNRADPSNIWKIFDKYELANSEFIGYWDERNEVDCSSSTVRATVYKKGEERYIALANFSNEDVKTEIRIKGISGYTLYCPYIERFQEERTLDNEVIIPKNRGVFIIVKNGKKRLFSSPRTACVK